MRRCVQALSAHSPLLDRPKVHLLLVPVPILHEALLLLSVPGRREKEAVDWSCRTHACLIGEWARVEKGPRLNLPDAFIELNGQADNLVVTQSPLLLFQDLTSVLVGAVGDCRGRQGDWSKTEQGTEDLGKEVGRGEIFHYLFWIQGSSGMRSVLWLGCCWAVTRRWKADHEYEGHVGSEGRRPCIQTVNLRALEEQNVFSRVG